MGVTAVYFSPTGNTKKSVEAMAAALDPGYKTVDLTLPSDTGVSCQFGPEDLVIIGMPVAFSWLPMETVIMMMRWWRWRTLPGSMDLL
ncbi:MAG: hypothetical protein E7B18_11445 [Clostridium sp.]|nr:hypothetical protein [Clostridium sp.]